MSKNTKTTGQEEEEVLRHHDDYSMIPCETCLKEIPKDLAHTEEADEYVLYFCGLECHGKWQKEAEKEDK